MMYVYVWTFSAPLTFGSRLVLPYIDGEKKPASFMPMDVLY